MIELVGTEKQVAFARRLRAAIDPEKALATFDAMAVARPVPAEAKATFAAVRAILVSVAEEARASWWIENAEFRADFLAALVEMTPDSPALPKARMAAFYNHVLSR